MRTDELIRALAAEPAASRRRVPEGRLSGAALAGLIAVLAMVAALLGFRPDMVAALVSPLGALKLAGMAAIAVAGYATACRLSRPGAPVLGPGAAVAALLLAWAAALAIGEGGPPRLYLPLPFLLHCVVSIVALSVLPLAAALIALRGGAPTRPAATGAMAGLLAGGLAAAGFALHCPLDGALDVAAAYGAAIMLVAAAGAVAGRHVLAW